MKLSELISLVKDDANVNTTVTSVSERVIREINRICAEVWNGFPWSFRWRNYRIITDVDVTAGTVTATNGSRTISGAGTAFSSSHRNWHIYFTGDSIQNWYRIRAYTSGTQLELDVPYQGTTGASKKYILRHFDYVLPTEPWDLGSVMVTSDNRPIPIIDPLSADIIAPNPISNGYPEAVAIYSSDAMPTTYTTGTVSGTINTTTLTGAATSWLDNVYPGDLVTIGSYQYTVREVNSDTQITLYNQQQVTTTAGSSYTITRQFGRIMRLVWPSVNAYTLDIRALRKYTDLVNNNDTNELLYQYPHAIALKVSSLELNRQDDVRSSKLAQEAELALLKAKAQDESLTQKRNVLPIHSYRTINGYQRDRIR